MQFDLMTAGGPLREVQDLARRAEAAGFSGLVLTETTRNAFVDAGAAVLATERLEIGTGIAVAFPRSPMITAASAWQLADASGGRFHLGLGTQVRAHIERRYGSEFDPPGPRMKEYLQAVRAIFAAFKGTARLDVHGEHYNLSLLPAAWSPGPIDHPDIPLYVAAVGPWMLRMAGEVADGIHVHPFHSRDYLEQVLAPAVAEGADRAGRDPRQVRRIVPVFTIVGDTEEERAPWRAMARSQIAFYGSTRNYAHQFDLLGFEGTSARLNERLKARDQEGMAALVTDEMLEHYAVTATWDDLSDRLVERYGDVADRLVVYFAEEMCRRHPPLWDRWGEVARDVVRRTAPTGS